MIRRHWGLGLAALTVIAGAVLLLANLGLETLHRSPIKLFPGLTGLVAAEPVPARPATLLDGQYQAAVAHSIGGAMPLYPAAVRLRNQLAYSLFGASPNPIILVGNDGALLERVYAEEYCSRDIAHWQPGARAWAGRVRQMQDILARRGQAFLYVLTPSKVAQYPELLPAGFTCPAPLEDRAGLVPAWIAMLHAAGVHVVDTTAPLWAAHGGYPFRLFPPGGTHWNAVGEAIGQQAVLAGIDRTIPAHGITAAPFTWQMRPHPVPNTDDVDLARLMNLFRPAANGPVPEVTFAPAPTPPTCPRTDIVIIGGSFSHATLRALGRSACPAAVEYEYWHTATLRWAAGRLVKRPDVDASARDAAVLAANMVLYEENEQILRDPQHGQALWAFLQAHEAAP